MKTIIIDAGHGGKDPGAIAFGIKEKDWNLKMSNYQYKRLKDLGAKVSMINRPSKSNQKQIRPLHLQPLQRLQR